MRGRTTRRGAPPAADQAGVTAEANEDDGEGSTWKAEMESIMDGTHPALVEALEPQEQKMKALIAQAERLRQLQVININALYEYEKKQTEDENVAQMEFFKSRLIDTIEEKQKKAVRARESGGRGTGDQSKQPADKRKCVEAPSAVLPSSYTLSPEQLKADMEEITTNVDHYSVRSAAVASDELRSGAGAEAWFDRSRQLLHCSGLTLERGNYVNVFTTQGQKVSGEETWQLHAMNAVEVTLKDSEGTKLKVTLAQLRNGRYNFRRAEQF